MRSLVAFVSVLVSVVVLTDPALAKRLAEFQQKMHEVVAEIEGFEDVKPRITGMIGNLSQKRPKDVLYKLSETGHIAETYIKSWGDLRNKHVHATIKDLEKPNSEYWQKFLDSIHQSEVILRQLAFYLIKYEGPFTDYGAVGFPLAQYPVVRAEPT